MELFSTVKRLKGIVSEKSFFLLEQTIQNKSLFRLYSGNSF